MEMLASWGSAHMGIYTVVQNIQNSLPIVLLEEVEKGPML